MKERFESGLSFHQVEVQISEQFRVQASPEPLHRVTLATLTHEKLESPCELAVVVTDDETLHELNRRHLGLDAPTDVLAFPNETSGPFVSASGLPRYLGDVIISFPRARTQAAEGGHSVQAELQLLVVHGVLHLLGYDDVVEEQRARMWGVQSEILRAQGVRLQLPT